MSERSGFVEGYGVRIEPGSSFLAVDELVSLGFRRNRKRAHLLVSRVLGKHIPQDPRVIAYAAHLLAAQVGSVLKPSLANRSGLGVCRVALSDFLAGRVGVESFPPIPEYAGLRGDPSAVVVGFAETATGLGFDVASHLGQWYIHSTRDFAGRRKFVAFEEEHSHATSHALIPDDGSPLENPDLPVVLVDDEFSTGKTAQNIIAEMHRLVPRKRYIIAALVDCRSQIHRRQMDTFADELGVEIRVVALASGEVILPDGLVDKIWSDFEDYDQDILSRHSETSPARLCFVPVDCQNVDVRPSRFGVMPQTYFPGVARRMAEEVSDQLVPGRTLVLGQEESMYFPRLVAEELSKMGLETLSSTTTRSPILVLNKDDYPVPNGVVFTNESGEDRFAYNVDGFENIVVPMEPGQKRPSITFREGLLNVLRLVTSNVVVGCSPE